MGAINDTSKEMLPLYSEVWLYTRTWKMSLGVRRRIIPLLGAASLFVPESGMYLYKAIFGYFGDPSPFVPEGGRCLLKPQVTSLCVGVAQKVFFIFNHV